MPVRTTKLPALTILATAVALAAGAAPAGAATASAAARATTAPATITGPITQVGTSTFTIQTAGRQVGVINALTATANKITNMNTPYVWGGGHAAAGVASVGAKGGPGSNGKRLGFDCSGSVAAVLAGAGLWPAGAGVPSDNGVISELLAQHLIARGVGSAPSSVTLYDDPGVHIFMNINGRFFGTSDGSGGGDKAGGAGWLDDGAWDATSRQYKKYHFLPSVLNQKTSYGANYTFSLPAGGLFAATKGSTLGISLGQLDLSDLAVGERVKVSYTPASSGAMVVSSIAVISGGPVLPVPTTPGATAPGSGTAPGSTTPGSTTPGATPAPGSTTLSTPSVTVPATTVTVPSGTVTITGTYGNSSGSGASPSSGGYGYASGNAVTDAHTGGASAGGGVTGAVAAGGGL